MDLTQPVTLSRTGLTVGRLGVASSYGAPAAAFEAAFERGCNYFYWGSMRKSAMREAIQTICSKGKRDQLVIVIQSYARFAWFIERSVEKALRSLGLDHAEVLLLGWYNKRPSKRILDKALELKQRGLVKAIAISGHNRLIFKEFAQDGCYDLFHVRYNAVHRGAETEVFPHITGLPPQNRPSIATYTATCWGKLLKPANMPAGEKTPSASDCYRFVLSNPSVEMCMTGPKDMAQMQEALKTLERGTMTDDELAWMRRIGEHIHKK